METEGSYTEVKAKDTLLSGCPKDAPRPKVAKQSVPDKVRYSKFFYTNTYPQKCFSCRTESSNIGLLLNIQPLMKFHNYYHALQQALESYGP